MNKLKPCPFCGGEAVLETTGSNDAGWYSFVECETCESINGSRLNHYAMEDSEAEALKNWNTRYSKEPKNNYSDIAIDIHKEIPAPPTVHKISSILRAYDSIENRSLLPKEPPLKLIADLYYKGDMEMAIHNKEVTKICIKDYKKALENYAKENK